LTHVFFPRIIIIEISLDFYGWTTSMRSLRTCSHNLVLLLLLLLVGCRQTGLPEAKTQPAIVPSPLAMPSNTSLPPMAPTVAAITPTHPLQVTITGWFTTIWNGEPHYTITDDQGNAAQVILDEDVARPLGGPLKLDRQRISIVGEIISDSPMIIRAVSIKME
jgi:hypothetical protein